MTAEDNKQAVRETWKAFASRNPAEIVARFTEDAQWIAPPGNATALALNSTHLMGRNDIVRFIAVDFGRLFARDVKVEFKEIYAEGDVVIVEQRFQATLSNGAAKGHRMIFAAA